MKSTIEKVIENERFNMTALRTAAWPLLAEHPSICKIYPTVAEHFKTTLRKLSDAIFRHVFLIELVKTPQIETTKFRCRWFAQLKEEQDPRWCSFDECLQIASDLFVDLCGGWLAIPLNAEAVNLCFENSLTPYEVPLDYVERPNASVPTNRIHRPGNLKWTNSDTMLRTLKLRHFLTKSKKSPDRDFFSRVLKDKIHIKTYLSDRVQTGLYKTNREKRWEVHPYSVHFAFRKTCMEIEYRLIEQLCTFKGFPEESRKILESVGILPEGLPVYRCPITLDKMDYESFHKQLFNPVAGKSDFQVGHLNPLKLDDPTASASGHTAENIAWVSAVGNTLQGSQSLTEVQAMIRRVASNYEEQDKANEEQVKATKAKLAGSDA